MSTKTVERMKPEGLLLALEMLAAKETEKVDAKGPEDLEGNFAFEVFGLIHPWLTIHVPDEETHCDTSIEDHEMEYAHTLKVVKEQLKKRSDSQE